MTDRIEQIRSMLERSPEDVFLHYGLGMEYVSTRQWDSAIEEFRQCIALDQEHLASYVELGKCFRAAGKFDEAREVFTSAITLADRQDAAHMRDHLRQQLEGLPGAS